MKKRQKLKTTTTELKKQNPIFQTQNHTLRNQMQNANQTVMNGIKRMVVGSG